MTDIIKFINKGW